MDWAHAVECREELVLFPEKLDEIISEDHPVRLLELPTCYDDLW
jgi:hypothetical protein